MFDLFFDRTGNFPAIDLLESENSYKLFADMPQMKKEDVKVNIEDVNLLCISGKRVCNYSSDEQHEIIFSERSFGSFKKCLRLRDPINADDISAKYTDNVLQVVIPKSNTSKTKSFISIN